MATTFLTAEWRNLIFANYAIDRRVLEPLLPYGTELDTFNDVCYGSLVGFYFQRVKMFGVIPVPFHTEFEEFNLRFYVRRKTPTGWKRGVVFVKEIVPKFAITLVANTLYGEPYATHPMRHTVALTPQSQQIGYEWKVGSDWNYIRVQADRAGHALTPDSEEAFITEHYWGYTRRDLPSVPAVPQNTKSYIQSGPSTRSRLSMYTVLFLTCTVLNLPHFLTDHPIPSFWPMARP